MRKVVGLTATLRPEPGEDSRAPGGAITVVLCGHWEHEGRCRWPDNTRIVVRDGLWTTRTIIVVDPAERDSVVDLVREALARDERWRLTDVHESPIEMTERQLAVRLGAETDAP